MRVRFFIVRFILIIMGFTNALSFIIFELPMLFKVCKQKEMCVLCVNSYAGQGYLVSPLTFR